MKKLIRELNKLSVGRKLQLMAALLLTVLLIIIIPVKAWFNYQRRIVKLQKVQAPNVLFLSAAHREDEVNFCIDGINADDLVLDGYGHKVLDDQGKEQKITHKDYVFCVTGEAVDQFAIQLAYTTNNPLCYEVYAAKEVTEPVRVEGEEDAYVAYKLTGDTVEEMPLLSGSQYNLDASAENDDVLYYTIDSTSYTNDGAVNGRYAGTYLNLKDGSTDTNQNAKNDDGYYGLSYGEYSSTNVHDDAIPVYWQATNLEALAGEQNANKEPFCRHFILRVRWEAGALQNSTKETDIIYITVKATK